MAIEKILQTRIMNKVDTLENWGKSALKIKQGEICFATVAATAGNGLTEPVIMAKIGTAEEKTFAELPWSFYAKASDVLSACKSEDTLKAFINGVIADAGLATDDAMTALADRVTTTEGEIETLKGDENTAGSVAKAIKDAIDALDLANTFNGKVDKVEGKSLVADTDTILPLATYLDGQYGAKDLCTGVLCKVGGSGLKEIVEFPLPEAEMKLFSEKLASLDKTFEALNVR